MATDIVTSFSQQCDSAGNPISGAKIYVYNVGTTTARDVFSDPDLDVSHAAANPIVCDSAGRHAMRYTATGSYKIVVKTSADVTVYTSDNIDGRVPVGSGALAIANGGTGATSASAAIAALGGATAAEVADVAADVAALAGAAASTEKTHIAVGTTAQRPAVPIEGDIRRNTTTGEYEAYDDASTWRNIITTENIAAQTLVSANMPAGSMVNSKVATYATSSDITSTIPFDDTIPQVGEGTQIISTTYTCASTTNKIRIRFRGTLSTTGADHMCAALFQDGAANAISAGHVYCAATSEHYPIYFEHEYTPATVSSMTYTVRVGTGSGSTMRMNGINTARRFGGIQAATLTIEEIKA